MLNTAVTNTSPLIFLAKAQQLDLLQLAGDPVLIPQPVFNEIAAYGPADVVIQRIRDKPWLKITPALAIPTLIQAWDLGPGESSVLAHGNAALGTTVILDDLEARRCAGALHLPVIGTIGLVIRARHSNVIPAARPIIESLIQHGMYLSPQFVRSVLASIGE